ncbi:MAG: tRNA pseudouridine synthase B [candidate division Zixibacteria bacterium RBG-1]|nr:MAG: tRNA pseudouridine synthase B [candidate division Zixibacteria bacterium RBG-1]OGC84072.1 MAG: tRNA pseudouridine(55) synthase TruB [candidate division Zixibacteria bacterium RBG_19FT_COMBO_42_43]
MDLAYLNYVRYEGGLVINKPTGITSHDTLDELRDLLPNISIGHTGTLDPQASGVLFALLGKATKIANFIENWDKEYSAKIKLGVKTDTYDMEGRILEVVDEFQVSESEIKESVGSLIGEISQIPPVYSAIKYKGKKLYEYARAGVEIKPERRKVTIKNLEIVNINLPYVELKINCSKGTYIRSIANDLGEKLGCGAVLAALIRNKVGPYTLEQAVTLEKVAEICNENKISDYIIPISVILKDLPKIVVEEGCEERIKNGMELKRENLASADSCESGETVKVINANGEVLAVGKFLVSSAELEKNKAGKIFQYLRVLI